jgi:hypothetical protein
VFWASTIFCILPEEVATEMHMKETRYTNKQQIITLTLLVIIKVFAVDPFTSIVRKIIIICKKISARKQYKLYPVLKITKLFEIGKSVNIISEFSKNNGGISTNKILFFAGTLISLLAISLNSENGKKICPKTDFLFRYFNSNLAIRIF